MAASLSSSVYRTECEFDNISSIWRTLMIDFDGQQGSRRVYMFEGQNPNQYRPHESNVLFMKLK